MLKRNSKLLARANTVMMFAGIYHDTMTLHWDKTLNLVTFRDNGYKTMCTALSQTYFLQDDLGFDNLRIKKREGSLYLVNKETNHELFEIYHEFSIGYESLRIYNRGEDV